MSRKYKVEQYAQHKLFVKGNPNNLANHLNAEYSQGWKMVKIFMVDGGCQVLYEKSKKPAKKHPSLRKTETQLLKNNSSPPKFSLADEKK